VKVTKVHLTTKKVQRLLTRRGRYRDDLTKGLLLVVQSPTSAAWTLRYQLGKTERWMGLGSARLLTLAQARERAREARLALLDKVDPLQARRAARAATAAAAAKTLTFREASVQFYDQHASRWKNRAHTAQFMSSLKRYVHPHIGDMPMSAIDTGAVLQVLEQRYQGQRLWDAVPVTAGRVRNRIERIWDFACVRGYCSGSNPARWKGHLSQTLPKKARAKKHFAALAYSELPAFMSKLRADNSLPARALEFLILTASRSGEVRGAVWNEIDMASKTWIVPALRMKGNREHRVPLSAAAVALLGALPTTDDDAVFVNLGLHAMPRALRELAPNATVHGFRSAFSDWAHETTSHANHVIELSLAHAVGSSVERSYRRGDLFDKRRALMQQWAVFCSSTPAAVIPLKPNKQTTKQTKLAAT
jgi:integrase